jgi:integrase
MPRKAKELSARAVAALKEPGAYAVGGVNGLYLSVASAEARSWLFRYSVKSGAQVRRREMGLGGFPKLSLSEARDKAREAQTGLNAGRDPIDARNSVKRVPTFWEVAEELLATVEASGKNPKHRQQWRNTLTDYAAPLHTKPVDIVTTDDVAAVLAPIWQAKPETASRLRGRIERVLSIAKAKGLRSGENPAAWRDNLEPILGKRRKLSRGHHEALPYEKVPDFLVALRRGGGVAALALEFTISTAARTGEVIGARWPEIDLKTKIWTVPPARMKAGREHRVPLSGRAVAILEAARKLRRDDSDVVFPGQSAEGCLSNMAMAAVLKRMKRDDITVHGFRSSFRDWAGEVSSFPNEVCEMALAHAIRDKAEAAYRRGDLFEKRRALMEAWAAYCEPPVGSERPTEEQADDSASPERGRGRPPLTDEQILARLAEGKALSRAAMARARAAGVSLEVRKRGPKWGSQSAPRDGDAAMLEDAARMARQMAEAGVGKANSIAVQALFEADHGEIGREAMAKAETALAKDEWEKLSPVVIEDGTLTPADADLQDAQLGPDPVGGDDIGFPERWISPVFETAAGRKALVDGGFDIPKSKDDGRKDGRVGHEVDAIAKNVQRHRAKQRQADAAQLDLLGWAATPRTGE